MSEVQSQNREVYLFVAHRQTPVSHGLFVISTRFFENMIKFPLTKGQNDAILHL